MISSEEFLKLPKVFEEFSDLDTCKVDAYAEGDICDDCYFKNTPLNLCEKIACRIEERKDGRDVYFAKKQ